MIVIVIAARVGLAAPPADELAHYAVPVRSAPAHVTITRRTAWTRHFRTDLARQAQQPVDFAGRYVLAAVGCGAECLTVGAIDRLNGNVVELGPTVCCWPETVTMPLRHRANSRLLVVEGRLNEAGGDGAHRFVLRRGAFHRLPDRRAARAE